MQLVVCELANIPPWLYPAVLADYPGPGISVEIPTMDEDDFSALWRAVAGDRAEDRSLVYEDSGCDVGFAHDAPDAVLRIRHELVVALSCIPHHERWRFAERWAERRHGKRPNKEDQISYKKLMNLICDHADHAIKMDHAMVLIEPVGTA